MKPQRTLYRRAIDNPSSLTDEERRIITYRPSDPEEDERCRHACGLIFSELVRKAINKRDSLSYHEAALLIGWHIPGEARRSEEIRDARANAGTVHRRGLQASSAAAKFLNDDDMRHIRIAMMVPWQEQMLSDTDEVCGLVGFYADREDWAAFREQIETAVCHGLR
ncbi:hypothetical protein BDV59DRAFT_199737 [Aspergillus ambiguus]|uniref:uncharacterized protein n=1 Tax=Aspergillus ambiguus TaxID=176160 RepID=UPI003CCE385D